MASPEGLLTSTAARPRTGAGRQPAGERRSVGRLVHPWAWWVWALGVAIAVSMTSNPLFLFLLASTVVFVVVWRRTDAPWAKAIGAYFTMALFIIALRLFFQVVVGSNRQGHVLFTLPEIPLPAWVAGFRIGGAVTAEALLFSLFDSLRLATMLLCVGAANALANPRRALRAVPAALYEASVAITISLSVAPQLIEAVQRVRRARRLRGGRATGWGAVRAIIIPVLEDAIERSMQLAAGMETRGFGRTRRHPSRWGQAALLLGSLVTTMGLFLLLGVRNGRNGGLACVAVGLVLAITGLAAGNRQLGVTRYRPDLWAWPEWATVAAGIGSAACGIALSVGGDPLLLSQVDLTWPTLHPLMLLSAAFALLPAFATPVPPHRALKV